MDQGAQHEEKRPSKRRVECDLPRMMRPCGDARILRDPCRASPAAHPARARRRPRAPPTSSRPPPPPPLREVDLAQHLPQLPLERQHHEVVRVPRPRPPLLVPSKVPAPAARCGEAPGAFVGRAPASLPRNTLSLIRSPAAPQTLKKRKSPRSNSTGRRRCRDRQAAPVVLPQPCVEPLVLGVGHGREREVQEGDVRAGHADGELVVGEDVLGRLVHLGGRTDSGRTDSGQADSAVSGGGGNDTCQRRAAEPARRADTQKTAGGTGAETPGARPEGERGVPWRTRGGPGPG